ncbi:MAG TPA: DNA replication/repair protein RecF [Nitriliruptorales bacterium]|nr:DNA replication/repair protein RecF [Nitriliruptorales bacterium]
MLLRRLDLTDVRSYARALVEFEPGVTLLIGPNAHGKTNLLEAVHRLAVGVSHRVSSDVPLIRRGAEAAYLRAEVETDGGRRRTVELELATGRPNRARVDGQQARRTADAIGVVRAVMFAPEDVALVRGDPGERRRFLDDLLSQRRPAYAAARGEYERVLRQRNRLLRSARGRAGPLPTLDVWSQQLVDQATTLTAARMAAVHALGEPARRAYAQLAGQPEPIALAYRSSAGVVLAADDPAGVPERALLATTIRDAVASAAAEERARGVTLIGPHRDDLELEVRGLPARGYASHGQVWSLALALRLAARDVLAEVGDRPILLLDDVFAELDGDRRQRLAVACGGWEQVVVTAAVEDDVPLRGVTFDVRMGDDVSAVSRR